MVRSRCHDVRLSGLSQEWTVSRLWFFGEKNRRAGTKILAPTVEERRGLRKGSVRPFPHGEALRKWPSIERRGRRGLIGETGYCLYRTLLAKGKVGCIWVGALPKMRKGV